MNFTPPDKRAITDGGATLTFGGANNQARVNTHDTRLERATTRPCPACQPAALRSAYMTGRLSIHRLAII